ncbi:MAG: serine protease, partial [Planctomycetota bacterium]
DHGAVMRFYLLIVLSGVLFASVVIADEPEYINDRAIRAMIERKGTQLIEAERVTPNPKLQEQLEKEGTYDAAPPAEFTLTKEGEDLYDAVDDGVLVISLLYICGKCDKFHGNNASGFMISKDGLAVTNHHVIENKEELTQTFIAVTRSGKAYPIVEVLASSDKYDLALIRLDIGNDKVSPLPIARTAEVGEDVHVVSHPKGRFYEYSKGTISRFLLSPRNKNTKRISVSSHYGGGSSGGPIFNDKGQVVAVVSEAEVVPDRKIVFYDAVPYSAILDLFKPKQQARE